jgi:superfamily II DNA/RNA helicase
MLSNVFSSFCCDAEKLYTQQWSRIDGVGALIITPTRELAYQVSVTFLKVGNRVSDPH